MTVASASAIGARVCAAACGHFITAYQLACSSQLSLDEFQPQVLLGEEPDASSWSVVNACSRFADTKLF